MAPFAVILVLLVVGGLIAWYAHVQAVRRREELTRLAGEVGWRYEPPHDGPLTDRLRRFSDLNQGHSHSAYNTLRGQIGMHGKPVDVCAGDYRYKITRNSGKNRSTTTYRLSYLLADLPFATTPTLAVRKEHFFDKVAGAIGFDDIDFESKAFSDRFHVKSRDQRFAYDVIDPRMIEFLLRESPRSVQLDRGRLLVVVDTRCWTPDEFRANIAWTRAFLDQWPRHVVDRLSSEVTY
ncbi:hypothetical protein [Botrimarina sp.]|uniref:hypothetical protein n=1 Tax=Botrimarina sp. TaxID=2795802 RepID=UPI0032EE0267